MVLTVTVSPNQIKESITLRTDNEMLKNFPAVYLDRYSYAEQLTIRAAYGEEPDRYRPKEDDVYGVYIGAFNSIAWDTQFIIDEDHDYKSVTTSKCELFYTGPFRHRRKGSVIIQNDVWIGQGCTVYGGVTIHNGAVVAGNSVVTKDVPPYTVVGGAPAKVIKTRFADESIVKKLLDIQWWYWDKEEIVKNQMWFQKEPEEFANYFGEAAYWKRRKEDRSFSDSIELPAYEKTFLFFPDFDEPYGVWPKVIRQFCSIFAKNADYGMVLFVDRNGDSEEYLRRVEALTANIEAECQMFFYLGDVEEEFDMFARADYYITSRSGRTVKRTCMADYFGVKILSGVDIPLFV